MVSRIWKEKGKFLCPCHWGNSPPSQGLQFIALTHEESKTFILFYVWYHSADLACIAKQKGMSCFFKMHTHTFPVQSSLPSFSCISRAHLFPLWGLLFLLKFTACLLSASCVQASYSIKMSKCYYSNQVKKQPLNSTSTLPTKRCHLCKRVGGVVVHFFFSW